MNHSLQVFGFLMLVSVTANQFTTMHAFAERERCNRCNGSRHCTVCGGNGQLSSCYNCGGSGRVTSSSISSDTVRTSSCSTCRGSGKRLCYDCRKTGRCKHCVDGYRYTAARQQPFVDSPSSMQAPRQQVGRAWQPSRDWEAVVKQLVARFRTTDVATWQALLRQLESELAAANDALGSSSQISRDLKTQLAKVNACLGMTKEQATVQAEYDKAEKAKPAAAAKPAAKPEPTTPKVTRQVRFRSVSQKYGVTQDEAVGMELRLHLDVFGMQHEQVSVNAYFFFDDDRPLQDTDSEYSDPEGQVATSETETMPYEHTIWSELRLFIPYEQLELEQYHLPSGTHSLYVHVEAQDSKGRVLGVAPKVEFHFKK